MAFCCKFISTFVFANVIDKFLIAFFMNHSV